MKAKEKNTVYLALILAMFFWGISFIWTKIVFEVYPPVTTIFLRLLIAAPIFILAGTLANRLQKPKKEDFKKLLLLSFFQPFLYFIGENFGLSLVSATVAAVVIATIPLFTPIAAYYFFKERLLMRNFLGIAISVLGVVLVVMKASLVIAVSIPGILYLSLAVAAAVAYSVLVLQLSQKYNPFSLITYQKPLSIGAPCNRGW